MSFGRTRVIKSRRRRWLVEPLEARVAPSDTLLLLGSLAAAMRPAADDAIGRSVNQGFAETTVTSSTSNTNSLSILPAAQTQRAAAAPTQDGPVAADDAKATDALFSMELVSLARELSLADAPENDSPSPLRLPAKPISAAAGTNDTVAPGGAAGTTGSGGGGGGGSGGIDGAAAAMAASTAAAAVPATVAQPAAAAGAQSASPARFSVSPADYIPPPPYAPDQSFTTYHDTPLVEADPGLEGGESGTIQSCVLDSNPTIGQISNWDGQGGFTYTPNYHAYGTDSFGYHFVDYYGQSSNPATVTITVTETAPEAYPDGTYWGDWNKTATSGNTITVDAFQGVLANDHDNDGPDTGNLKAVKDSDPTNGSLTLNSDGSFIYVPNVGFGGYDQFTYHATDGILASATVVVSLAVQKVDLDMWDGGTNPNEVPDDKENTRGAFTVTNLNDTNGSGFADFAESPVAATPNGRDELDLMQLVINKPVPNLGGSVTLSLSQGLSLWTDKIKTSPYPPGGGVPAISVDDLPMTLYVEAGAESKSLRDMEVSAMYDDSSDSVNVTGVWLDITGVSDGAAWSSPDEVVAKFPDLTQGGQAAKPAGAMASFNGTGVIPEAAVDPMTGIGGIRNGIMIQWTIVPTRGPNDGTWENDGVMFDVGRQTEANEWALVNGVWKVQNAPQFVMPTAVEGVNDDPPSFDESDVVNMPANHFYSYDAPGYPTLNAGQIPPKQFNENVYQVHAKDFLRVQFNGQRPDGNTQTGVGSRCSDYQEWWSQISVVVEPSNGNITRGGAPHVSDIETQPVFATLGPPFAK